MQKKLPRLDCKMPDGDGDARNLAACKIRRRGRGRQARTHAHGCKNRDYFSARFRLVLENLRIYSIGPHDLLARAVCVFSF